MSPHAAPTADPSELPMFAANPCRCPEADVIAYLDDDLDLTCSRCGRLISSEVGASPA